MAEKNVLSQEEIDALLKSVDDSSEEEAQSTASQEAAKKKPSRKKVVLLSRMKSMRLGMELLSLLLLLKRVKLKHSTFRVKNGS